MRAMSGELSHFVLVRGDDLRCAGGVGAVHGLAQLAVVGVLHHRNVGGRVQRELPALLALLLRRGPRREPRVFGNAGEVRFIRNVLREGVGGVQQVFLELRRQGCQFFLDLLEAGLQVLRQFGARQAEIAHLVVHDLLAARRTGRRNRPLARISLNLLNSLRFWPSSA